ncbi:FIG01057804: hypothetical protein [hydrothermal vent metagenome]|uniref:Uncharacterized protein n=1 Tax=hydrothermal vent metagenome TaxID=652676 RepID=A0A3B0XS69_9ZZZZ
MKNITDRLSLAACTLISCSVQQVHSEKSDWDIDFSYLYYKEADDRVNVNKLITKIYSYLSDADRVSALFVLDTMSGATPSGAIRDSNPNTTTGASEITDIAKFNDTRLAMNFSWEHDKNRKQTYIYNGNISVENDYQSYGGGFIFNHTNDKITTYTSQIAASYNIVARRSGGTPEPLSPTNINSSLSEGIKYTFDGMFGMSKILNRRTIIELNLSLGYSIGYLNDPYKVISLTQPYIDANNLTYGLTETGRYYEARPDARVRSSIYTSMAHQYGGRNEVIHFSYRFYADDWDITAHTIEFKHRKPLNLGDNGYIEPHIRLHSQTSAIFFKHSISDNGDTLPEYASADYRLDAMQGITAGLTFGLGRFRTHLEYIIQNYEKSEYGQNKALVLQFSYQKIF